jgi:hypothetical protein
VLQVKDIDLSFHKDLIRSHITRRTATNVRKEDREKKNRREGERKV